MKKSNDLAEFMQDVTRKIEFDYNWIQKRTLEDPGTAGDQGEENWASILRNWLPSYYHIVTKGRILGVNGDASPQIDVLVLKPSYPKALLGYKLYLASEVAAAFECKITLKKEHITDVFKKSVLVKKLQRGLPGNFVSEMYSPIIYGLLSHSHEWKKAQSKPIGNITKAIEVADSKHIGSMIEQPDFFCVSDLACWSVWKMPLKQEIITRDKYPRVEYLDHPVSGYGLSAQGLFESNKKHEEHFTALASFLAKLFWRLSKSDPNIANLSIYFNKALFHPIKIKTVREWPKHTLSLEAKKKLENLDHETLYEFLHHDHWHDPLR